jgi:aminopeptidase N
MVGRRRGALALLLVAALVAGLLAAGRLAHPRRRAAAAPPPAGAAVPPAAATPGAPGIGDRLFPNLGNGGYDVRQYTIRLRWLVPSRTVQALVTVDAVATQALSRFDLDFQGNVISQVTLGGRPVRSRRAGAKLVVTPASPIAAGRRFSVLVAYRADPRGRFDCSAPPPLTGSAWFPTADGFVVAGQPNCMHTVFPSNDDQRDKALYRFVVDVPAGTVAVANGTLAGRVDRGGRSVWSYRTRDPLASELVQIAVGRYAVLRRSGPHGLPVRDVVPAGVAAAVEPTLAGTPSQIAWMEGKVGRFPFESYGLLLADLNIRFALETQTLSLFPVSWFAGDRRFPERLVAPIMVHELAHQWFGDSVSPASWSDVWLNEGHATWYEALYADERGWASLEQRMRGAYAAADQWRRRYGPVGRPSASNVFNPGVYDGGALVLFALRQTIGAGAFGELERRWVATYRDGVAGTPQFIALASEVAGRNLARLLNAWVYGTRTPRMPGHPDWKLLPAGGSAPRP